MTTSVPSMAQASRTVSRTRCTESSRVSRGAVAPAVPGTPASAVAASSAAEKSLQAVVTDAFLVRDCGTADLRGGPPDVTETTSTNHLYNCGFPAEAARAGLAGSGRVPAIIHSGASNCPQWTSVRARDNGREASGRTSSRRSAERVNRAGRPVGERKGSRAPPRLRIRVRARLVAQPLPLSLVHLHYAGPSGAGPGPARGAPATGETGGGWVGQWSKACARVRGRTLRAWARRASRSCAGCWPA